MRIFIIVAFVFMALNFGVGFAYGETESKDFSNVGKWKITDENQTLIVDKNWCRAIGRFDGNDVEIVLGQSLPDYGSMSLSITTHQHRLPEGYKGNANLLIDGKVAAAGRMEDVGDWQGEKRTAFYARASFDKIEPIKEKLQHATKLVVAGDNAIFKPLELENLDLNRVVTELQRCLR